MKKIIPVILISFALLGTASAQAIRKAVGEPLMQARGLVQANNFPAAEAKVKQAEAVPNKTPNETLAVSQMKQYIAAKKAGTVRP